MRIPAPEQRRLLDLEETDKALAKSAHESENLASEQEARSLDQRRHALHLEAVRRRTEAEDFGRQAKRIDEDIERVRARQNRNKELANSGADARLQRELQHESDSLDRRRRELEDAEISFLEREEEEGAHAARVAHEEATVAADLEEARVRAARDRKELDDRIAGLKKDREDVVSRVSKPLLDLYSDARSRRGIGVALLEGSQCSACRLELTLSELTRLRETSADEVETCEECGCLLIRD